MKQINAEIPLLNDTFRCNPPQKLTLWGNAFGGIGKTSDRPGSHG